MATIKLDQLPEEVLNLVLSHVDSCQDVLQVGQTCQALSKTVKRAPIHVHVEDAGTTCTSDDANRKILGISQSMRGSVSLTFYTFPLQDSHLPLFLSKLPRLRLLHFHACRKLTSKASTIILNALIKRTIPGVSAVSRDSLTSAYLHADVIHQGRHSPASAVAPRRVGDGSSDTDRCQARTCPRGVKHLGGSCLAQSCPNLTSEVAKQWNVGCEGSVGDATYGLHAIVFHKCYQMKAGTLTNIMRLATLPAGRNLCTVCLSYIDFDQDKWLRGTRQADAAATSLEVSQHSQQGHVDTDEGVSEGSGGIRVGGVRPFERGNLDDVISEALDSVDQADSFTMSRFIGDEEDLEGRIRRVKLQNVQALDSDDTGGLEFGQEGQTSLGPSFQPKLHYDQFDVAPSPTPEQSGISNACETGGESDNEGDDGSLDFSLNNNYNYNNYLCGDDVKSDTYVGTCNIGGLQQSLVKRVHWQPTHVTIFSLHFCKGITELSLQAIVQLCPKLRFVGLGGTYISQSTNATTMPQKYVETRGLAQQHLAQMEPPLEPILAFQLLELLTFALCLGSLKVLEVTFLLPHYIDLLSTALAQLAPDRSVAVWDFSSSASVQAATTLLDQATLGGAGAAAWLESVPEGSHHVPPHHHMRLGLLGAANCRSMWAMTPLHVAAETGDLHMLKGLLQLGADVHQRGQRSASPLFLACEGGFAAAARELLAHGADPWVGTKSMETTLYIAALKGHLAVVQVLLDHFEKIGTKWWVPTNYGDGWTPLMAVAVSNHFAVAKELFERADRMQTGGAKELSMAQNMYGSTAAHICARRNQCRLLRAICQAGGRDVVMVRDSNDKLALDIAYENKSKAAALLLKEYTGEDGGVGKLSRGASGGKRRSRRRNGWQQNKNQHY